MSNRNALFIGLLAGFTSALIAAAWQVATRYGVTSSLPPPDLALLRYGIPAIALSPLLFKHGAIPANVHRGWFALAVCSGGFVYGAFAMIGARYSPVAHMGILISGTMPLFTALLLYYSTRAAIGRQRSFGYALILIGALVFGFASARISFADAWFGDLLFIGASISWAFFTLSLRKLALPPWYATALVCFWSSLAVVAWVVWNGQSRLLAAPTSDVALQIALQGFVAGVLGTFIFAVSIRTLGASNAAIFGAFVPAFSAIGGYLLLYEAISLTTAISIAVVIAGTVLARDRQSR